MMRSNIAKAATVFGAAGMALAAGMGQASAGIYPPSTTQNVKVGGAKTVYSGQVGIDQAGDYSECPSNAWLASSAVWTLNSVSKTAISVKSIKISFRTGVTSMALVQYLERGNHASVWKTNWTKGDISGDAKDHSATYTINKSVPLDGQSTILFASTVSLGRTGGPAYCGGNFLLTFKLHPVS